MRMSSQKDAFVSILGDVINLRLHNDRPDPLSQFQIAMLATMCGFEHYRLPNGSYRVNFDEGHFDY